MPRLGEGDHDPFLAGRHRLRLISESPVCLPATGRLPGARTLRSRTPNLEVAFMGTTSKAPLADVLSRSDGRLLSEWVQHQLAAVTMRRDLVSETELSDQSSR